MALLQAMRSHAQTAHSPSAAQRTAPAPAAALKGVNGNELYRLAPSELQSTVGRFLALGVSWVRFDFDWSVLQPTSAEEFRWEAHDRVVRALGKAGLQVLGVIDYTPPWANGAKTSKFHPPADPKTFARFAASLARRYGPMGVHTWEIWNEPNLGQFWLPAPNVARYVELLRITAEQLREADPSVFIVSGGLAQPGNGPTSIRSIDFLREMYRLGAASAFDAVGNHPYSAPTLPEDRRYSNWRLMFEGHPNFRTVMVAHGDAHKSIWITEFGAPTHGVDRYGTVVSEEHQARLVEQAYRQVTVQPWAGPLFWYNFQDFCAYGSRPDSECFYGLVRVDGTEKPAAAAFRAAGAFKRKSN